MAGVADRAFREICKDFGADYLVGEMASAKGLCMSDRKTAELLYLDKYERPAAIQLFGDDPKILAQAAEISMEFLPDIIDINMGCPAPKIAGNGGGAALMKNPKLCGDIIKSVCEAVPVPVTAKIRSGWDFDSVNAVEVAKICEQNGAAAICVHGRTRAQMYSLSADYEIIRQVKQAVSVPVIGNGDVVSIQSAARMYEETDCDFVLVGRGALGKPWLFSQINAYLGEGGIMPEPPLAKRLSVFRNQTEKAVLYKGEFIALKEARKHASWYLKGLPHAAAFRRETSALNTMEDLDRFILSVLSA